MASRTRRSPPGCSSARGLPSTTSARSSASSTSALATNSSTCCPQARAHESVVDRSSRFAITSMADAIAGGGLRTYGQGRLDSLQEVPLPHSDTGERLTPVLDFPFRDGLAVQAVRVDYEPGGFTRETHRHPAGASGYVIEGSVMFGLDGREPVVVKAGESVYEPPGALHSVSRNASDDQPASLIAFFVLGEGESSTVYDHDERDARCQAAGTGRSVAACDQRHRPASTRSGRGAGPSARGGDHPRRAAVAD